MWMDKIQIVLESPITWGIVTLIFSAIAFSGRLSVSLSNILLGVGFFMGCFGIYRSGLGIHLGIVLCLLLGIGLTTISWWIQPRALSSPEAVAQQSNFTQNLPGISLHALIKLTDLTVNRRKYIFDFGRIDGSRLSVYTSSDNVFTLAFVDAKGEPYPVQVPIGRKGVPFGKFFYLVCEVGIDSQSTSLRILVDGQQIQAIALPFKVDLGGLDVPGGVVGADLNGNNGASFDVLVLYVLSTTMTQSQIATLKKAMDDYQSSKPNFMVFSGKQWMRVNEVGSRDLHQANKLFQPFGKNNEPINYEAL